MKPFSMPRLALDRAPDRGERRYDLDGRLHLDKCILTEATCNDYLGRELPGWQALGLDPNRTFRLLRGPDELAAAVDTFNGLPLLSRHVAVSASDHKPAAVIGASGSSAKFEFPYLKNSLVVWSGADIAKIEDGTKKSLSCSYRFLPDMTPGAFQGQQYDGVMRALCGNHVSVVADPRVTSAVIGDAKPTRQSAEAEFRERFPEARRIRVL